MVFERLFFKKTHQSSHLKLSCAASFNEPKDGFDTVVRIIGRFDFEAVASLTNREKKIRLRKIKKNTSGIEFCSSSETLPAAAGTSIEAGFTVTGFAIVDLEPLCEKMSSNNAHWQEDDDDDRIDGFVS